MKILYIIIFLLLFVNVSNAATYFVRTNGGTTTQCTGLTNANYSGSGSAQACAYSNLQDAIDAVTFGDTIKIHAGDRVSTTPDYQFGEFSLTNKGTPPTNTDSDYITITTDDPTGTPSALAGYAATRNRITTAMAANMPKVVAEGSTPLFRIKNGAKYWKIERLNITNDSTNGWQTKYFVDTDDPITALNMVPHHIIFQYNWIHPDEETGTDLNSTNKDRSAENGIGIAVEHAIIRYNAIQGFVGRVRYGGEVGDRMTTSAVLIGSYAADVLIQNNLLEAWTYAFFVGGSSMPDWTVTEGGTIVSCSSSTVCTFSNVTGLQVNDPLSIFVASAATWGSTYVSSIVGNVVTFNAPLCHTYDGGNTCVNITGNPIPAAADKIRWNGLLPNNIRIKQNIFAHYPSWATFLDGETSGKGYLEVKACADQGNGPCIFDGNIFTGDNGPTVTVRNQAGDFCWVSLDGLTFSNNVWEDSQRIFTTYLRDTSPTPKSRNVNWTNNLILGVSGMVSNYPGGEFSANTGGGINTSFVHNTVAWNKTHTPGMTLSSWHNFINFFNITTNGVNPPGGNTMENFTFKDNIIPMGQNSCFGGTSITDCWPAATVNTNVFINVDNHDPSNMNAWWLTTFPSNTLITSYSPVQFINPMSDLGAGSGANYAVANTSPYKNAASDGTDIGVNMSLVNAALGFTYSGAAVSSPKKCNWHANPRCTQ